MKAVKRDCFDNSLFFWYNSQMDAKYKQGVAIGSNREMEKKINVLGVELDNYQVDEAMEMVGEYMQNDLLNTIGIVTMQMLLLADEDEQWKTYLKDLDMSIIGETEILTAAGIEEDGTLYEEVEANEFIARLFWYLIQIGSRIFVLGETEDEVESLEKYLQDKFFKQLSDHLNLFMYLPKTPFIWHLTSGPHHAIELYVSIYKWSRDTVFRIKSVYIANRETALNDRLSGVDISTANGKLEAAELKEQLKELKAFAEKIDELLASGYDPKLDDGVGKNIAPLQKAGLLSYEVLNAGQLKKYLNADW